MSKFKKWTGAGLKSQNALYRRTAVVILASACYAILVWKAAVSGYQEAYDSFVYDHEEVKEDICRVWNKPINSKGDDK